MAFGFNDLNKNFNTNLNLATLDVVFNSTGLTAAGGRYSDPGFNPLLLPSNGAGNTASAQPYNFGAASFDYAVVPEAASVAVWGMLSLAVMGGLWIRRRFAVKDAATSGDNEQV